MKLRCLILVCGLLADPSVVEGQEGESSDEWHRTGIGRIGGIRYSVPFKLSIYGGISSAAFDGCGRLHPEAGCDFTFHRIGLVTEVGAAGGQVSLTSGSVSTHPFPVATRAQVSLMRTWRHSLVAAPNETYLGAEVRVALMAGFGIGVFRRISDGPSDEWVVLGGVHIGV